MYEIPVSRFDEKKKEKGPFVQQIKRVILTVPVLLSQSLKNNKKMKNISLKNFRL